MNVFLDEFNCSSISSDRQTILTSYFGYAVYDFFLDKKENNELEKLPRSLVKLIEEISEETLQIGEKHQTRELIHNLGKRKYHKLKGQLEFYLLPIYKP